MTLPQEILDKIFLLLDYETLECTRELQSEHVKESTKYNCLYKAKTTKNLKNERWLRQQGNAYLPNTLSEAVLAGYDNEVLEFMYANGFKWDRDTFEIAADMGDLNTMKWLYSKGCHPGTNVFSSAALNGDIEVLKWLRSIDCPWDSNVFASSARKGYLKNLKWLHAEGCPQGNRAIQNAVIGGHLEVIKWLIEIGHIVNDFTFNIAITSNSKEIIKFLKEYRTRQPIPNDITESSYFSLITN